MAIRRRMIAIVALVTTLITSGANAAWSEEATPATPSSPTASAAATPDDPWRFGDIHAERPDIRLPTPAEAARLGELTAMTTNGEKRAGDPAAVEAAYREIVQIDERTIGPDHPNTALWRSYLASFLAANGKVAEAVSMFQRSVASLEARLGPAHPLTLSTLSSLSSELSLTERQAESEPLRRRVLAGTESNFGMEHRETGLAALNLADTISAQHRYAEANPLFERARLIFEKQPGYSGNDLITLCRDYASSLDTEGKYRESESLYRRVVSITEANAGPQTADTATALTFLGNNLSSQQRQDDAYVEFNRAYTILSAIRPANDFDVANALSNVGSTRTSQGRYSEGEPLLRRSVQILESIRGENNFWTISALQGLASNLSGQLRVAEAEAVSRRALAGAQGLYGVDDPRTSVNLANFAAILALEGRFAEAEALYRQVLAMDEKTQGRDSIGVAGDLNSLSGVIFGRPGEIETLRRRAWSIDEARLGPTHATTADAMVEVAQSLLSLNRFSEGEALLRRAVSIYDTTLGADTSGGANAELFLGAAILLQHRGDEAAIYFQRALAFYKRKFGENSLQVASTLTLIGVREGDAGRYADSVNALAQSTAIYETLLGADNQQTSISRIFFGLGLVAAGRASEAEPQLRHVLAIAEAASNADGIAWATEYLARALVALNRPAEALPLARRAMQIRQSTLPARTTGNATLQPSTGNDGARAFQLVRATWMLAKQEPGMTAVLRAEAFEAVQSVGESSSSDALSQGAARLTAERAGAGDAVDAWRNAQLHIGVIDKQIADAAVHGASRDEAQTKLVADRSAAVNELDRAEAALASRFPRYFDLVKSTPISIQNLQTTQGDATKLLREDEALIVLAPGIDIASPANGLVFVVTKETAAWAEIPLWRNDLKAKVASLHDALASPISTNATGRSADRDNIRYSRAEAYTVYQALFGAPELVAALAGKTRWLLAPQGVLMSLPFAALVTAPPPGGAAGDSDPASLRATSWLGLSQTLTIVPSVAALRVQRLLAVRRPETNRTAFFGMGDPAFSGRPDGPVAGDEVRGGPPIKTASAYYRGAVADLATLSTLPRLTSTAREIRTLAYSLGAGPDSYVLQLAASEAELRGRDRDGRLGRADVIAFATHGIMAGQMQANIAEPALALTPPAPQPGVPLVSDNDGLLTASEAATLTLSAQWVILSACNTASGGDPDADSLTGLARAFLYAGAQSLLVSHFPVLDTAAMRLTTEATRLARTQGMGRPEALRASMATLLRDQSMDSSGASFAHPTAWAPFAIIDPN